MSRGIPRGTALLFVSLRESLIGHIGVRHEKEGKTERDMRLAYSVSDQWEREERQREEGEGRGERGREGEGVSDLSPNVFLPIFSTSAISPFGSWKRERREGSWKEKRVYGGVATTTTNRFGHSWEMISLSFSLLSSVEQWHLFLPSLQSTSFHFLPQLFLETRQKMLLFFYCSS